MQSAVQTQHAPAPPPGVSHADSKLDSSSPTASTAAESSTIDEKKEGPLADTAPYVPQHYHAQQLHYQYYDAAAYGSHHHPMMHPMMSASAASTTGGGGGVPPQQVYVSTAMQQQPQQKPGGRGALGPSDTQFQSLTFNSGNPSDHQSSSQQQQQEDNFSSSGQLPDGPGAENLEEEEEHTDEEEPVKLFVGQVSGHIAFGQTRVSRISAVVFVLTFSAVFRYRATVSV